MLALGAQREDEGGENGAWMTSKAASGSGRRLPPVPPPRRRPSPLPMRRRARTRPSRLRKRLSGTGCSIPPACAARPPQPWG